MLTFLKTLFQKNPVTAPVAMAPSVSASPARATATVRPAGEPSLPVPQVAVARLSLLAILQKLPSDLQPNISNFPDASVTIALPVATIQKQLAAGSVKMSLASLYRQSPAGTFGSARVEEKRMIEVPLAEVLKHVEPATFRRRADQRRTELPKNAPQLFGDRSNPFAVAPSEGESESEPGERVNGTNGHGGDEIPPVEGMTAPPYTMPLRMTPEPLGPKAVKAVAAAPEVQGDVTLPLAQLCGAWPEPARSEAASQPEASLVVPAALLAPGMAKGKVAFSWGQVRGWITPALAGNTEAREGTEIVLPLKIVAPAFIAFTRPKAAVRKEIDLDESIPAMFDGGEAARSVTPAQPEESLAPEPEPALQPPSDLPSFRLATGVPVAEESPAPSEPVMTIKMPAPMEVAATIETAAPVEVVEVSAHVEPTAPIDAPVRAIVEEAPVPAPAPAPAPDAHFGPSEKKHWSPQAMIESTAALPGVAGAIVALREGLVVAAKLPEHMKGDTVAAFLPQIFARLNHYTQEMQLGEVEDLLLTINGAHFQSYHMGEVYFAVLGKAGEALPWAELRLVVQELQAQTLA